MRDPLVRNLFVAQTGYACSLTLTGLVVDMGRKRVHFQGQATFEVFEDCSWRLKDAVSTYVEVGSNGHHPDHRVCIRQSEGSSIWVVGTIDEIDEPHCVKEEE